MSKEDYSHVALRASVRPTEASNARFTRVGQQTDSYGPRGLSFQIYVPTLLLQFAAIIAEKRIFLRISSQRK
jgi:hypothetical protein